MQPLVARGRRWGRPHHVECLNQNTSPKQRLSLHKHSILFHTGKRSKATCLFVMQHALCCVSFLLTLPSWQWQRKNKNEFSSIPFKLLSMSIMANSHVLNSPSQLQTNHKILINSKNLHLVHKVVVKTCSFRKMQNAEFFRKNGPICC